MRLRRHAVLAATIAVLAAGLPAASRAGPSNAAADPGPAVTAAAGHVTGQGFDTAKAPPTSAIRAWTASPFRAVNMYFAGSQRLFTDQPELSPSWVSTVLANGWSIIPTVVDLQAPCASTPKQKMSTDSATAGDQGAHAATLAVAGLADLGLPPGLPAYVDIEPYTVPAGNTTCVPAVRAFVRGWTETMHASGYLAGLYSTPTTGIKDIREAPEPYPQPDAIWFARYDGVNSVDNANIPADYLAHHRIHQYQNSTAYTYGGLTLTIDKDAMDGDAVVATSVTLPTGPPYLYAASTPAGQALAVREAPTMAAQATGQMFPDDAPLPIECQTIGPAGDGGAVVHGDAVWDRLTGGGYVSDLFTTTTGGNGFSPGIPRCETTPPVVTVKPLALGTLATGVTLSYGATDPSGVASYDVVWRRAPYDNGYSRWQYPTAWQHTAATTRTLALSAGYTYCFEVRASDGLGNRSAWSPATCTARALDDRSLSVGTNWKRRIDSGFYLGTVTSTATSGATATRSGAEALRLGLVVTRCVTCGTVRVSIGGVDVGDVDLRAAARYRRSLVLLPPLSVLRAGKVVVRVTSPAGKVVQLDGLVVSRA
ncbi:MAG TPA: glycoside hydrolase domain-containing protein [Mycobacteriales bacterium]|nr:glycoside hydrolase domain-containing protein [Mycobacteriales bacterium]